MLISTIGGWNYRFDWMSFRFRWFARFPEPRTLILIRHGKVLRGNLGHSLLTIEELQSQLRKEGVASIAQERYAALEPDGRISAIRDK